MARSLNIAYLNGSYVPVADARISPLDRGFLFGDAVYEVVAFFGGEPMLANAHLQRLDRSLAELEIPNPHSFAEWEDIVHNLARKNGGGDLTVYLQVSRGADKGRDQVYPQSLTPTVFGMAMPMPVADYSEGCQAITLADNRWGRCDIKSTSLLANVLLRQQAHRAGAIDAILLRDGYVTEAAVSSVIIVENGSLVRRPNGTDILAGTTTDFVVELAAHGGIKCVEDTISEARLRAADEVWLLGATKAIAPVVQLDSKPVGKGQPGLVWQKVTELFETHIND